MKKLTSAYTRPWFLWIGGACFLVGSLVAGSVGLASSAPTPGAATITANQGQAGASAWKVDGSGVTQPVSGTVGLSAGTKDIGTVHVAEQQPYSAEAQQQPPSGSDEADAVFPITSAPIVLQTLSVSVNVSAGDVMSTCAAQVSPPSGPNEGAYIPMTKQGSIGSDDTYVGTVANLDINVPSDSTIQIFCSFNSPAIDLAIKADAYGQYLS